MPHFPKKTGGPKDQMTREGDRLYPELAKVASLTTVRWQEPHSDTDSREQAFGGPRDMELEE